MQENAKYWTYNLSEFVFRVANMNFDWVPTWWGILSLVLVFGGAFIGLKLWSKKLAAANRESGVYNTLHFLLGISFLAFWVFFGLKKAGIDWGLRWYSTMYVAAYIQVYAVVYYWIKHKNMMMTHIMLDSLIGYIFIGMLLGARSFYVLVYNWEYYKNHLEDVLKVWHGGLSFHGGIVGVTIAFILYSRRFKLPFWHLLDRMALTVPFGIAIGRIGNFMNGGELYGRVISSDVPWAVIFPQGGPLPRHPSQLYQSFCEGWLLLLTLYLVSRKKHREGTIGAAAVFFYGLYRFPMEFFREADEQLRYYFNNTLTMGQILCIVTMLFGVILYWITRNNLVEGSEAWTTRLNNFLKAREEIEAEPKKE